MRVLATFILQIFHAEVSWLDGRVTALLAVIQTPCSCSYLMTLGSFLMTAGIWRQVLGDSLFVSVSPYSPRRKLLFYAEMMFQSHFSPNNFIKLNGILLMKWYNNQHIRSPSVQDSRILKSFIRPNSDRNIKDFGEDQLSILVVSAGRYFHSWIQSQSISQVLYKDRKRLCNISCQTRPEVSEADHQRNRV